MIFIVKVLWQTDHTEKMETVGVEVNVDDYERREMCFYNIDAISPNRAYEGREYCNIIIANDSYVVPDTYDNLFNSIMKAREVPMFIHAIP